MNEKQPQGFTDAEKIDWIRDLFAELHTNNFSFEAFAVLVEIIDAAAELGLLMNKKEQS